MSLQGKAFHLSIVHGFGTASEPIPTEIPNWEDTRPRWKQVHGTSFCEVNEKGQECGEVDALFTFQRNLPIGVVTADCAPILMAHRYSRGVAAVHSGWRGTKARILLKVWDELARRGQSPSDWIACIGPMIGPCCFEVSEELQKEFITEFDSLPKEKITPSFRHIDLRAILQADLERIGLGKIEIFNHCTFCNKSPVFHSYRRDGSKSRQISLISASNV